jgi:putative transposase
MPNRRKYLPHDAPFYIDTQGSRYFITINLQDPAQSVLIAGETPVRILDSVRFYQNAGKWQVTVALLMPNHVHMILSFPEELSFKQVVRNWKRWVSRNCGIDWQDDFFDHRIRTDESLNEKALYVLHNPVRAGLVERWQDWPHKMLGEDVEV